MHCQVGRIQGPQRRGDRPSVSASVDRRQWPATGVAAQQNIQGCGSGHLGQPMGDAHRYFLDGSFQCLGHYRRPGCQRHWHRREHLAVLGRELADRYLHRDTAGLGDLHNSGRTGCPTVGVAIAEPRRRRRFVECIDAVLQDTAGEIASHLHVTSELALTTRLVPVLDQPRALHDEDSGGIGPLVDRIVEAIEVAPPEGLSLPVVISAGSRDHGGRRLVRSPIGRGAVSGEICQRAPNLIGFLLRLFACGRRR
ncbi:Uncharacterised protein [Mycobacteroides abscessus subsp. abscessus]|nr:Uncharacterised protein [Mycobacteroides abscessus subsp. abscessus]